MSTVDDKRSVQEICKKCAMKWKGRKQGMLKGWFKNFKKSVKGLQGMSVICARNLQ